MRGLGDDWGDVMSPQDYYHYHHYHNNNHHYLKHQTGHIFIAPQGSVSPVPLVQGS